MRSTLGVSAQNPTPMADVSFEKLEEAAFYALIYIAENLAYDKGRQFREEYQARQDERDYQENQVVSNGQPVE